MFRQPLSFFQRRKLETQFGEQVPEFSEQYKIRRSLQNTSYGGSALLGGMFALTIKKLTHQPIAGIFAAGIAFVTGKAVLDTFGPTWYGLNKFSKDEYERAFDLWVYYKGLPTPVIDSAEKRYQERFSQWRKSQTVENVENKH
jgi:hypothetical protein